MGPQDPLKSQKSIPMGSMVFLDPKGPSKKISSILGTGCHKVCTCWLNGATWYLQYFMLFFLDFFLVF